MRLYTNVARIGVMRKILVDKHKIARSRLDTYQLITALSHSLNFPVDFKSIIVFSIKFCACRFVNYRLFRLLIVTKSPLLGPSSEGNTSAVGEKLPRVFSDPEGSLPCSQQLAAAHYPNVDQSRPRLTSYCFNIYCNIVLQARPVPSGLFPLDYPCSSYVLHILHILSLPNNCEGVQVMKLLVMQSPPASSYSSL
jgi:hypothetical protein